MNSKEKYIALCQTNQSIPIFMQHGWLDAVITEGTSWEAVLAFDEKEAIIGALTFISKKKMGKANDVSATLTIEKIFTLNQQDLYTAQISLTCARRTV